MSRSDELSAVLVVDSGSPLVSVAFGSPHEILARRSMAMAHSSEALLRSIDEVLSEAGATIGEVRRLIGLQGPGSFTGLRVGLATLLGLHQALGVPATTLPSLEVLSLAAGRGPEPIAALVDALRDEWFAQVFAGGQALGPARTVATEDLGALGAERLVGHGIGSLPVGTAVGVERVEAGELAPWGLRLLAQREIEWAPESLLEPLYLRAPMIHGRGG